MNTRIRPSLVTSACLLAAILLIAVPLSAADGKKWDGKKYLFSLLDPKQTNSEANPFIIDTAGKFAYLAWLGNNDNLDMVTFGAKNGLKGLTQGMNGNYFKMTADLDMNGAAHELPTIKNGPANFDGGDHTISNLRISDTSTPPELDSDWGTAEMNLSLFKDVGNIKNLHIGKGSSLTFKGIYKKFLLKVSVATIALEAWTIDNCSSEATITVKSHGDARVAGLVLACPKVSNCQNRGNISFEGDVILARDFNLAKRVMPGPLQIAGVCCGPEKLLANCTNSGAIMVKAAADSLELGGISAAHPNPEVSNLENSGTITVQASGDIKTAYVGGLVGRGFTTTRLIGYGAKFVNPGLIRNSGPIDARFMTGKNLHIGGIGGGETQTSNFSGNSAKFGGVYGYLNACNIGKIKVTSSGTVDCLAVGGIAGREAMIFNSYNSASLTTSSGPGTKLHLGGLGGYFIYSQNSYNCGALSASGSGSNSVGGLIGSTNAYWGETEKAKYTVLTSVWFREAQEGGVNNSLSFAKGSYQGAADNFNGTSYITDSASATVLATSDDAAGKRQDFAGSLVDLLNQTAAAHTDRYYRLWKLDPAVNGGFPVFE